MDTAAPKTPKTQAAVIRFFADHATCLRVLVALRWRDGNVACPTCGRTDVTYLSDYRRWKCRTKHPRQQFSLKVGTLFEDSAIGLDKWLPAVWMITNAKNGVSSYKVARALGVTQKTGWFMLHRIRLAMQDGRTSRRGRLPIPSLPLPTWMPRLTPDQRFVEATKHVLSVSKQELEKREKAWRRKPRVARRPATTAGHAMKDHPRWLKWHEAE